MKGDGMSETVCNTCRCAFCEGERGQIIDLCDEHSSLQAEVVRLQGERATALGLLQELVEATDPWLDDGDFDQWDDPLAQWRCSWCQWPKEMGHRPACGRGEALIQRRASQAFLKEADHE